MPGKEGILLSNFCIKPELLCATDSLQYSVRFCARTYVRTGAGMATGHGFPNNLKEYFNEQCESDTVAGR